MSQTAIDNRDLQEDEVLSLSNIYNPSEFSYNKESTISCYFNVFPCADNSLKLENIYEDLNSDSSSVCLIKYLPPIRIDLELPIGYPTEEPPNFYITTPWLSPWQISLICQKLDEIWLDNKNQEVLYSWFEFLRTDLFNFLEIKDTLDISFIHMVYYKITDYFHLSLTLKSDTRAIYSPSFVAPVIFLITYDKNQQEIEFQDSFYNCAICLETYRGKHCKRIKSCGHVYCKECIVGYISVKIKEYAHINNIGCPQPSCNHSITYHEIKEFCPELFSEYDNLLLKKTIGAMQDVIYCPRMSCQYPFVRNSDDTLAVCKQCEYAFCTYCNKVYHGATPCSMTSKDSAALIEEYNRCNTQQKKVLVQKYGRQQIQLIVERHLTQNYIKNNAKPCPRCSTMIEKSDGCNRMLCSHCNAYFCWLCGLEITTKNPYEHFGSFESTCHMLLFAGSLPNDLE